MNHSMIRKSAKPAFGGALVLSIAALSAYSGIAAATHVKVTLVGDEEVPPVKTMATGVGTIVIATDGAVSGSVTTTGMEGTVAHIHEGAMGKNGPVVIPLTKSGDTYSVPAGARLTEAQLVSFKASNIYVNAHTKMNPGGEIRAQLKP